MAQDEPEYRMEIGGGLGLTAYQGDLGGGLFSSMQPKDKMRRLMNTEK